MNLKYIIILSIVAIVIAYCIRRNFIEHYTPSNEISNEVIQNIASVYSKENMILTNANITNKLVVTNKDIIVELNKFNDL